jgi:hypothetical protein
VALVFDLRMTTGLATSTVKVTRRWSSSTRLRRLENSSATCTANLLKHSFEAATAWPFVAKLLAGMCSTLQWTSTDFETDVLRFNVLGNRCRVQGSMLTLCSLSFTGFLLARAATLTAFVAATIEG